MTTITPPIEYPPILPIGFHRVTLESLRALCVDAFPGSTTRSAIMSGLVEVVGRLIQADVRVEIWVNGSFMTQKLDPHDADIVLRVPIEVYEQGTQDQRETLDWVKANQKGQCLCDSYVLFVFPANDARATLNDYHHAYWIRQFGFSRGQELKGIAVLVTGGAP